MDNIDAIGYLEKEVDSGIASHHIDGKHHVIAFYNPEDEAAFILRFGKTFMAEDDRGFYYCPYIPTGVK